MHQEEKGSEPLSPQSTEQIPPAPSSGVNRRTAVLFSKKKSKKAGQGKKAGRPPKMKGPSMDIDSDSEEEEIVPRRTRGAAASEAAQVSLSSTLGASPPTPGRATRKRTAEALGADTEQVAQASKRVHIERPQSPSMTLRSPPSPASTAPYSPGPRSPAGGPYSPGARSPAAGPYSPGPRSPAGGPYSPGGYRSGGPGSPYSPCPRSPGARSPRSPEDFSTKGESFQTYRSFTGVATDAETTSAGDSSDSESTDSYTSGDDSSSEDGSGSARHSKRGRCIETCFLKLPTICEGKYISGHQTAKTSSSHILL